MALTEKAQAVLADLREAHVDAGHPNHKAWYFLPKREDVPAYAEIRVHGYIKQIEIGRNARCGLTDLGLRVLLNDGHRAGSTPVNLHHHGDVHTGSTFTTNITGSTLDAFAPRGRAAG